MDDVGWLIGGLTVLTRFENRMRCLSLLRYRRWCYGILLSIRETETATLYGDLKLLRFESVIVASSSGI